MSTREVPWLVYDGDCAFCTSSARWIAARLERGPRPPATLVPWQFSDLRSLGIEPERAQREALWVTTGGRVYGGAPAFARWLVHAGGAYAVLGRAMSLPGARALASAVYRLVARNRHRMPGGSPACAISPKEPGLDR